MSLTDLQAKRAAWLDNLRSNFENGLKADVRDTAQWQVAIRYCVRLIENALDFVVAAQTMISPDPFIGVARQLGEEMSHVDDGDEIMMIVQWGKMNTWYSKGISEMIRHADTDEMEDILSVAFLNWGAFYSRLNLPEPDGQGG